MSFDNPTPLRLGMMGTLEGRVWTVKARMVLGVVEDGETYYWNEFILTSGDQLLYLELDEGQWRQMRPFEPKNPPSAKALETAQVGQRVSIQGSAARVTKKDTARVHHIEGSPPFSTTVGQSYRYIDADEGEMLFAADWTDSGEVDFFRGRPVSEGMVRHAFAIQEPAPPPPTPAGAGLLAVFWVSFALTVVCFIAAAVARRSGEAVYTTSVPFADALAKKARVGPIELDPARSPFRLSITMSADNARGWVSGVVEKPNGLELIGIQDVLYSESGENLLMTTGEFKVRNPGPYFVRLHATKDSGYGGIQGYSVEIRQNVKVPGPFRTYGWIMAAVAILSLIGIMFRKTR